MKILLITDNHTPSGGAENYFFDLKARLKTQSGFDVYSLGFGPHQSAGTDFLVLKSPPWRMTKILWRIVFHPLIYLKLRRYLRKINPDLIHVHNIKQHTLSLLHAIKPYPVVQTVHDFSYLCPTAQNIHKNRLPCVSGLRKTCFWQHQVKHNKLIYLCLSYAFLKTRHRCQTIIKKYIAPSPLLRDYLKQNHFNDVTYIPPFKIEKNHFSFTNMNPHQFLFAGNLGSHKGIDLLLDEFVIACQKNPDLLLCIAGKGSEEKKMRQRVKEQGLESKVNFLGWQCNMNVHYDKSIAVIFPSIGLEAFGLVITEGMSYARPVIGVNRGTCSWLIDDKQTGLLFDPDVKGDLAVKILSIAGNRELAMELGKNGFEKLQCMMSNEEIMQQIIAVYEEAVRLDR